MKKLFSLFLITLFSVSMWADQTYYYKGEANGSDWAKTAMNVSQDGFYEYYSVTSNFNHQFLIGTAADENAYNYTYVHAGFNSTDVANIGDYNKTNCYCWYGSAHYILVYYPNTAVNTTNDPIICASTTLPNSVTIYFVNTPGWADDAVNAHVWKGESDKYKEWPGDYMTKTAETTVNGYSVFSYTFPGEYTKAKFSSKGSNESSQWEWDLEKPYFSYNMGRSYANVNDVPKFHIILHGTFSGGWADEPAPFEEAVSATSVSYTVKGLAASSVYTFGVKISGTWNNLTDNITSSHTSAYLTTSGSNPTITTGAAGDYIFTYYYDTNLLTVTYPTATALDNTADEAKAVKRIVNGQLVIEREGKLFNALGAEVK